MSQTLPWIIALVAVAVMAPALVWFALRPRKAAATRPLPTEWTLSARPVFSNDERRIYRQLREALPHHIVLAKLPLVRFCQPDDPQQVRYWYELLGAIHVTYAVCSANGRVLAAIDLANDRNSPTRATQIKQSVLAACRVRYLRCPVDHVPSIPELQLLVPQSAAASRAPQPAPTAPTAAYQARPGPGQGPMPARRRERTALWQDSGFFHDSFFSTDNRRDAGNSEMGAFDSTSGRGPLGEPPARRDQPRDDDPRSNPVRH